MKPTFDQGDFVLVRKMSGKKATRSLKVGDVVVFYHKEKLMVKRVIEVNMEDLFVLGDNPQESTDSRNFGNIPMDEILGKVLRKL